MSERDKNILHCLLEALKYLPGGVNDTSKTEIMDAIELITGITTP